MKPTKYRHLARELERYYRKPGSQRIFRNGLNQNKLIGEMAELSGVDNLEGSVLTRAILGERLLSDYLLDAFSLALGLDEDEQWDLKCAAVRDRGEEYGLTISFSSAPAVIKMLVRSVDELDLAIEDGSFSLAVKQLVGLYASISELGDDEPSVPLLRILSLAELERSKLVAALADTPYSKSENERRLLLVEPNDVPSIEEVTGAIPLADIERDFWQRYHVDGLSVGEIADSEDLTEGTVLSVLESAREQIVRHLASEVE